jgi:hypothetical protein
MVVLYVLGALAILGVFMLLRSRGSDIQEMPLPPPRRPPPGGSDDPRR